MEMNKSLKIGGLVIVISMSRAGMSRADETADKIAELRKLRENLSLVHLTATSVSRSGSETRESKIELWEKNREGKQRLRRTTMVKVDVGTPNEQIVPVTMTVKDGETAFREVDTGGKKIVFKGKAELRTEYNEMEPLLKKGAAKISSAAEQILGQPCIVLEIRDKDKPEEIIASYWISTKNGIIMKSVIDSPGETVTEYNVTELNLEDSFSNHLFNYKPPGDAQVIQNPGGKKSD